ncbi:hypothetical protein HQP42_19205 [Rhodococcus fascians]|nr:hypothetical protein [Rhodococcus fascians]MBY3827292.1 hypothetical protein [Rhodococcus fascians]MBY3838044.1 hypothetical protein [Rhodococcus fascians]MBY3867316.1 hypothetical protein [Rhodococcus fascians]MBY3886307.1 hypothetical protein [Rhodococcus fascians]
MHEDEASWGDGPLPIALRVVLDGSVPDGANFVVLGVIADVTVKTSDQAGDWASGRVVDGADAIEFLMFPRALSRTDKTCLHAGRRVTMSARLSITATRTMLVLNRVRVSSNAESRNVRYP